jgi:hypothetical protein
MREIPSRHRAASLPIGYHPACAYPARERHGVLGQAQSPRLSRTLVMCESRSGCALAPSIRGSAASRAAR